jgi:hypothetical protein
MPEKKIEGAENTEFIRGFASILFTYYTDNNNNNKQTKRNSMV